MSEPYRRRTPEDLQQLTLQRALRHLTALRPSVPFPLRALHFALEADLFVEDPPEITEIPGASDAPADLITILIAPQAPIALDIGEAYDIVGTDPERAVISVSPLQRGALEAAIRDIHRFGAWLPERTLPDSEIVLTSVLSQLVDDPTVAPDHLALLAPHALLWLEHALAQDDSEAAYGAVQLSAALWALVEREALAPAAITPTAPQALALVERYADRWPGDPAPLTWLAAIGAALAETEEPDLQPWADRALALGERMTQTLTGVERSDVLRRLQQARRRAGR